MVKNRKRIAAIAAVLLVALAGATPASGAEDATPGLPLMVGLGDSWTFGQGADDPATGGYFALAHGMLQDAWDCLPAVSPNAKDGCKHLQTYSFARPALPGVPGVTTQAVIDEQLPVVVPLLEDRNGDQNPRNDVEMIYLTVGGNDLSGPIIAACVFGLGDCDQAINDAFTTVTVNLNVILGSLRGAAGPDTPIVVVTYDNPIRYCNIGLGYPAAIDLGDQMLFAFDQVAKAVGSPYGVTVVTMLGELDDQGYWVGGDDCLHPSGAGHEIVAEFAAGALG